ncbi:MAG: RIP metalloprotease RseP [Bdellovibrionaceae bacterium]|nr:RIP metalloprotease RseP [Pseudobdellovibrionaceae bacterium]
MDIIFGYLQSGLSAFVPFVILLGLLIFVHELGHFAVAKWCGVRVETFSLGFGKKILKYKKGDTTYALSLIPLGGYVKMFGDEVGADISAADKKYSFLHKNVWQRIAIVLAGPLMNFFFAILVLFVVALIGEDARKPAVGDVAAETSAYQAGVRSGDMVISVGGAGVRTWDEFQHEMNQRVGQVVELSLQRYGFNEPVKVQVSPQSRPNPNILSLDENIGEVPGLVNHSYAAVVGIRSKTPSEKIGLRTGDRIAKINGKEIQYFREIEPLILPLQGQTVSLEVERWPSLGASKSETVMIDTQLPSFSSLEALGLEKSELYLSKIVEKSPAEKAGLLAGDRILKVDGVDAKSWESVLDVVKAYKGEGNMTFTVLRQGEIKDIAIKPEITAQMNAQGGEDKRYTVGIMPWIAMAMPPFEKISADGVFPALKRGFDRTIDITVMTVVSFLRLAQSKISPKSIGGVISIGQAASETFKTGITQFLTMMAIISVNLFILNLLPIPVLDGGHLLFYAVEAIRGAPLSMRKMEIAQQVGLVLLMSLMVFALFNDFTRLFASH